MVAPLAGVGPSTMASRQSNPSESQVNAAITPIETMPYVMKIVVTSRISGSSIAGNRIAANSNAPLNWSGNRKPGVMRNASTPMIAWRT